MTSPASEVNTILYGVGKFGTPYLGTAFNLEIDGFDGLAEMLRAASLEPYDPANKVFREWVSPAILKPDAEQRRIADIQYLAPFVCLDLDAPGWSLARLRGTLQRVQMIIYTSASSTYAHPRWRLIIALDRCYSVVEHRRVWKWFNIALSGDADAQTKDASRISYFPATYTGANNQFYVEAGEPMQIDAMLMDVAEDEPQVIVAPTDLGELPDGVVLITPAMIEKHTANASGRMFKILCAACTRAKANGWQITADQLFMEAVVVARAIHHRDTDAMLLRECDRAIEYINMRVETPSRLDKARERVRWDTEMKRKRRQSLLDTGDSTSV